MTTQDQQSPPPKTQLPRYRCHKIVEAAQITAITAVDLGTALFLADQTTTASVYLVNDQWMAKHEPKVGGYFVRYDDGYESFSPADAFESGYTRIEP